MIAALRLLAAGMAGALALSGAARGEVLPVAGVYPADSDGAAAMNAIAIENFGGPDGPDLAIRIGNALRAVDIDGKRYFRILAGGFAAEADGVLRGSGAAEVSRYRYTEKRDRCVSKENGKCVERRKEEVRCTRRTVELVPTIQLIARDGDVVHADIRPESIQDSRCEDDSPQSRTIEDMIRELSDRIANRTRAALAPNERHESIRVIEDRKGLSREDGDRFRNALRLTKTDAGAACRQWQLIAEANPDHVATAFNIGLCDEAAGDLDRAGEAYRRAARLSRDGAIAQGLSRLDARARADRQLRAHARK